MSTQVVTQRVVCCQDHGYRPCDGHELQVKFAHTSMVVTVRVDGDLRFIGDANLWRALMAAGQAPGAFGL